MSRRVIFHEAASLWTTPRHAFHWWGRDTNIYNLEISLAKAPGFGAGRVGQKVFGMVIGVSGSCRGAESQD